MDIFFKNQSLPPYLLAKDVNNAKPFWRTLETLGEMESQRGRFKPHTEPSNFHTDDRQILKAAEEIVRQYVAASTLNPDFEEIKTQFDLPEAEEAESLLPH